MTPLPWIVVETLAPQGPYTVVVDGDRPKNWASLARARSSCGADVAKRISDIVYRCVETGVEEQDEAVARQSNGRIRIIGVPVLGAFGQVHAVHVWVGAKSETPPKRRGVFAWEWDAEAELAYQGPGLEAAIHGLAPADQKVERTASENFRSIVRFDDRVGYLDLCGQGHGGGSWQGEITFLGDVNGLHQLQMIAKASLPCNPQIIHGLFHEITDVRPPEPVIEVSALRAVAAASGRGVALVALKPALIYDWLSPPPPPLDMWCVENAETSGSDLHALREACSAVIEDGESGEFRDVRAILDG